MPVRDNCSRPGLRPHTGGGERRQHSPRHEDQHRITPVAIIAPILFTPADTDAAAVTSPPNTSHCTLGLRDDSLARFAVSGRTQENGLQSKCGPFGLTVYPRPEPIERAVVRSACGCTRAQAAMTEYIIGPAHTEPPRHNRACTHPRTVTAHRGIQLGHHGGMFSGRQYSLDTFPPGSCNHTIIIQKNPSEPADPNTDMTIQRTAVEALAPSEYPIHDEAAHHSDTIAAFGMNISNRVKPSPGPPTLQSCQLLATAPLIALDVTKPAPRVVTTSITTRRTRYHVNPESRSRTSCSIKNSAAIPIGYEPHRKLRWTHYPTEDYRRTRTSSTIS